ncbi:LamG domain-containing protein [Maridesulfovibrio frigidus]|uniref:LamG domain-containing protein n=1 Tax=Maridesulfovibrio frigidus TaxID=340956 RepID=UPI0004E0B99A|nr:LamG domain-containing protein [Maridesulfovibrio frigidus]
MISLKNLAESFITSAISDTATEITIPADHADLFPSLLAGDHFRCALVNPATSAVEWINVTARNGNVLTVSRGEESVTAMPFPVESRIHLRMTAATWEEMASECWMRPKDQSGEAVIPQFIDSTHFSVAGDYTDFFKTNRAIKSYPNLSVGFVESAIFADDKTTVKVIEMVVPDPLSHIEAGLDPDALAKRTLSNEELLGYMTPVPVITMEALEVDGGTLVHGTISHPVAGNAYPDLTEFQFSLPDNVTDFALTGLSFQLRVPIVMEENSPQAIGPISCRAAQMSLILSDHSDLITLSARYVGISAGVTLAYADTQEGYPGADVNADGAKLPACTVGLNNPSGKSILSGRPEFEITGAELTVLEGTTKDVLKTSKEIFQNDEIVTDQGESVIGAVTTEEGVVFNPWASFKLEDTGELGATITDSSSNGRDLTVTGTSGHTPSVYIVEDGMNGILWNNCMVGYQDGSYASIPFGTGRPISFCCYLKDIYAVDVGNTYNFFAGFEGAGGYIARMGIAKAVDHYNFGIWTNTLSNNSQGPDLPLNTFDTPRHVAVVIDGTDIKIYLGGVLNSTKVDAATLSDYTLQNFHLGGDNLANYPFNGKMFEPILFDRALTAEEVLDVMSWTNPTFSAPISLPLAPVKAFKKSVVGATIAIGATDEILSKETPLTLGVGSTTSSIVLTSDTSIKDKIYTDGSIHKNIKCDGQVVAVASVIEAVVESKFITTVTLTTPLAQIPTEVALSDCFSIPSAIESYAINGSALKFTGTKVDISDPAAKRLALKVVGADSLRVKATKIYAEEGV